MWKVEGKENERDKRRPSEAGGGLDRRKGNHAGNFRGATLDLKTRSSKMSPVSLGANRILVRKNITEAMYLQTYSFRLLGRYDLAADGE